MEHDETIKLIYKRFRYGYPLTHEDIIELIHAIERAKPYLEATTPYWGNTARVQANVDLQRLRDLEEGIIQAAKKAR